MEGLHQQHEATIGTVATLHNVSLRTLRFYEEKGLVEPRRQGNARFYSASDQARVAVILKCRSMGFTLREIHAMVVAGARGKTLAPGTDGPDAAIDLGTTIDLATAEARIADLEARKAEAEAAIAGLKAVVARIWEISETRDGSVGRDAMAA